MVVAKKSTKSERTMFLVATAFHILAVYDLIIRLSEILVKWSLVREKRGN